MTPELFLMMLAAVLAAVVLYTFIGFIPGTDETSVLAPVTLAVVLAGLGVNSLSMTPVALDDVRAALAEVTLEEAKAKAAAALNGDYYNSADR